MKRIIINLKKYMPLMITSMVLAVITVAAQLYVPILSGNAIDLIAAGAVTEDADAGDTVSGVDALYSGLVDLDGIASILKAMVIFILIAALAQWLMSMINNSITYRAVRDMRTGCFGHMMKLPLSYVDSHEYGDVVSRIVTDIDQFSDGLLMGFTQLFTGVITIVGTLGFMLAVDVKITLVVVVLTPVSLLISSFVAKRTHAMFLKQSEERGQLTGLVDEMVGNQKIVQAFSYEGRAAERFDDINERLTDASLKATFFSSITNPSTRLINNTVYAGVGLVGAFACLTGKLTIGQLTIFLSYATQFAKPFNEISGVMTEMQNAVACADRVFDLMEEPVEEPVSEETEKEALSSAGAELAAEATCGSESGRSEVEASKDAATVSNSADKQTDGSAELRHETENSADDDRKILGKVDINHVRFSYTDKPLITDLDIHVKPGQRVAIVGPTGCGKSTIINLLMRFYDVKDGSIEVDDCDIRDMKRHTLRGNYGMVLQETWLKSATVRENIAYGHPDATDEEIIEAAKKTHAHSFIKRLPEGYDTVLSEDGGQLSQGQKQLLCITRVMLRLPPMLILDEATSSIDTRTEQRIQKTFARMMQGRTSFIVAHRLSTIKEADVILVMKDGNIIEQGNHAELLKRGGFYSNLYNSQFSE